MKSSEFIQAANRQGRRKAAKSKSFKLDRKQLGYLGTASSIALLTSGLVGIQAANAETPELAYDRCKNLADEYDSNALVDEGAVHIDLDAVTMNTWTLIRSVIVDSTKSTSPEGPDTIFLCSSNPNLRITVDTTISGMNTDSLRLVNGTLGGGQQDGLQYQTVNSEGRFERSAPRNAITFVGSGGTLFQSNIDLTLGGLNFEGFETVVNAPGIDLEINASTFIDGTGTQIIMDGGDEYTQSGTLSIVGSNFYGNDQAVSVEGLDNLLITSSRFEGNGSVGFGDRMILPQEPGAESVKNGGAISIKEMKHSAGFDVVIKDSDFVSNEANIGGAMYLENTDLQISNVRFRDNAAFRGGAISANDDSLVKIYDAVLFDNNYSYYTGGAIDARDSEFVMGDLSSTRVRFENNQAGFEGAPGLLPRAGGAIYGFLTEFDVVGTYFLANKAEAGGAVFLTENSSFVAPSQVTFKDNNAYESGGALQAMESSTVNMTDANFNNNESVLGGAVHADESTMTFADSEFGFNYASERGGAIYSTRRDTNPNITENQVNLIDSDFTSNTVGAANPNSTTFEDGSGEDVTFGGQFDSFNYVGGAVHIWRGELNVDGGNFRANSATDHGGAISSRASSVTIHGANFDENFTKLVMSRDFDASGDIDDLQLGINENYGNVAQDKGGSIFTYSGSSLTISDSSFTNGEAAIGGAIFADNDVTMSGTSLNSNFSRFGGGALYSTGNVTFDGGYVMYNTTNTAGGAFYVEGDLDIANGTFIGNKAVRDGGALYVGGDVDIRESQFTSNESRDLGGAVRVAGTANVLNSGFTSNVAQDEGGALYVGSSGEDSVVINGSTFRLNTAGHDGGAVYSRGRVSVDNSSFSENYSGNDGGAIFTPEDIIATASNFEQNIADDDGGALYGYYGVSSTGSTFSGNSAGDDGGAINTEEGGGRIVSSTFTGNVAGGDGGAIALDGYRFDSYIRESVFQSNSAESEGGAIWADDDLVVETSSFKENTAAYGGAIHADDVEISDSYFGHNSSTAAEDFTIGGGALYVDDGVVNRSVFAYNTANRFSAIYGDELDVVNSTFVSNSADASEVMLSTSGNVLFNTFVGSGEDFLFLAGGEDYSQADPFTAELTEAVVGRADLVFGNIFPGGTERVTVNGSPILRDGKPVYKFFPGGVALEEEFKTDFRKDSQGNALNDNNDIIPAETIYPYTGFVENHALKFVDLDEGGSASSMNFFTSSVEKMSEGINLHFKPTGNLARDFVHGNKVGSVGFATEIGEVDDVLSYLQFVTGDQEPELWNLLTATRASVNNVPSNVVGPRVGIDQSGSVRSLLWDAGAREFGVVTITPPPPQVTGGGPAPSPVVVAPPAPVVEFAKVTSFVRGFAPNSAQLTSAMRSRIKRVIAANPGATSVVCKGFTSAPPTAGDAALSRARGKAVCDYIKRLNPDLTVRVLKGAYENTPGQQIRRVRIVLR
jgi:predicted outer membrane repeat protein